MTKTCGFLKAFGNSNVLWGLSTTNIDWGRCSLRSCWPEPLTKQLPWCREMWLEKEKKKKKKLWQTSEVFLINPFGLKQHFILWRAQMHFSFTVYYFISQPNVSVKMVRKKSLSWFCRWMEGAMLKLDDLIRFMHLEQTQIPRFLWLLSLDASVFYLKISNEGERIIFLWLNDCVRKGCRGVNFYFSCCNYALPQKAQLFFFFFFP